MWAQNPDYPFIDFWILHENRIDFFEKLKRNLAIFLSDCNSQEYHNDAFQRLYGILAIHMSTFVHQFNCKYTVFLRKKNVFNFLLNILLMDLLG